MTFEQQLLAEAVFGSRHIPGKFRATAKVMRSYIAVKCTSMGRNTLAVPVFPAVVAQMPHHGTTPFASDCQTAFEAFTVSATSIRLLTSVPAKASEIETNQRNAA